MAFNAQIRAVNADGTLTVQFLAYLTAIENGVLVINSVDLANIQPTLGWQRFLSDVGIVVTGNGTNWLEPDGSVYL